jgi:SAM-dependent methyltransferase
MNGFDSEWFVDEEFWRAFYPFMFPEASFVTAAENVPKISSLSGVLNGAVLDLACGPGRYAVPLTQAGYRITGVDSTPFLLNKGRELAATAGANVEWIERDMREFVRPEAFDLALNVFTSFGYFESEADNRRVLENIHASLKPGGVFVFDHLGKEVLAARFQPTRSDTLSDGRLMIQRVSIIDDWSRVAGEWTLIEGDRATTFRNCHWLYSGHEVRQLLKSVGFESVSLFGSLDGTPYDHQALRLVAVARKPGS